MLVDQLTQGLVIGYHNKLDTSYPIITKAIFKIILPHQLPVGNNVK